MKCYRGGHWVEFFHGPTFNYMGFFFSKYYHSQSLEMKDFLLNSKPHFITEMDPFI